MSNSAAYIEAINHANAELGIRPVNAVSALDPTDGRVNTDGPMLARVRLREGQRVYCCLCGRWADRAYADLNGRPFEDFYCEKCFTEITA